MVLKVNNQAALHFQGVLYCEFSTSPFRAIFQLLYRHDFFFFLNRHFTFPPPINNDEFAMLIFKCFIFFSFTPFPPMDITVTV